MKYYLIAGEASGDLHAACLMRELRKMDSQAQFRFIGGDNMAEAGGHLVKHYRELAYMGFIPVLLHLPTILSNMRLCKHDILKFSPDALILVDYPGFNLEMAKFVKKHTQIPIFYYISPKIWAWKEHRIKAIKRDVDTMLSILPFEVDFYRKHHYDITYVGNPTVEETDTFSHTCRETEEHFRMRHKLTEHPIIALLPGSRKQEIKSNLPLMIEAAQQLPTCQPIIACAPGIASEYYERFTKGKHVRLIFAETFSLLKHAAAAMVTSGTATLETALLDVPQVVCYHMRGGRMISWLKDHFLKVKYISLVNLIANKEVVRELIADQMTAQNAAEEVQRLISDKKYRQQMLHEYLQMRKTLGNSSAATLAAETIVRKIGQPHRFQTR